MASLMRLICLLAGILLWQAEAAAQDYPTKAINFLLPCPPAVPPDTSPACWATN